MAKKDGEVPGNSLQSAINVERMLLKQARPIMILSDRTDGQRHPDYTLKEVRVRAPAELSGEWLGIVKADFDGTPCIGFHGGDSLLDCLKGLASRLNNGSMKWREDQYG